MSDKDFVVGSVTSPVAVVEEETLTGGPPRLFGKEKPKTVYTVKPKISVVIPYYESDPEKKLLLQRCINSLKNYDEIIIVWNDGMGFTRAVNKGYELARGDFIVMICDDVYFVEGDLLDLIDFDAVTCPQVTDKPLQNFWGTCWCTPRWVYEQIGMIPEDYANGINYEDDDYVMRLRANGIPYYVQGLSKVAHPEGGRTVKMMPERQAKIDRNREAFIKNWGVEHATF